MVLVAEFACIYIMTFNDENSIRKKFQLLLCASEYPAREHLHENRPEAMIHFFVDRKYPYLSSSH